MDPAKSGEEAGRGLAAAALAAAEGFEFRTFLCGTRPPPDLGEREADAFRKGANRGLTLALDAAWGGTRTVDLRAPEASFHVRFPGGTVTLEFAPLAVAGRYRKHSRSLPQTPFHCRECRGRGCRACGGSGRLVPGSVAELVLPALVEASGATGGTFHGCGREDVDVRMLGTGRPFAVLLESPRRRTMDLAACAARANAAAAGAAEFLDLAPSSREAMRLLTSVHPAKRYRARVEVEGGATAEDAALLARTLTGARIEQRTPERVAGRRADLVRPRTVLGAEAALLPDGALELSLRTEGGTYVKELISGDGGRTVPSVSSLLGRPARCVVLDVLEIESAETAEKGDGRN